MMICPNCDTYMADDAESCSFCGKIFDRPVAPRTESRLRVAEQEEFKESRCPFCGRVFEGGSVFFGKNGERHMLAKPVVLYKRCPVCDKRFEDQSRFCNMCGARLEEVYGSSSVDPAVRTCPICGKTYPASHNFCPSCGCKL